MAVEIQVFAELPEHLIDRRTDAFLLPENWKWVHCLTFPTTELAALDFWPRPFQWIRFAIGVVIGARGHLHTHIDGTPATLVNYEEGLPLESVALYYCTNRDEKHFVFPIDPGLINSRITTSTGGSTRRGDFRDDVEHRDSTCVVTEIDSLRCDAMHLLPHSKGDAYIEEYTTRRIHARDEGDVMSDINDIRNGIFIDSGLHNAMGLRVGIMALPNFAMPDEAPRCIIHGFTGAYKALGLTPTSQIIRSGSSLRMSNTDWPPSRLFDATYASTVMFNFGSKTLLNELKEWQDVFYPGGAKTAQEKEMDKAREAKAAHDPAVSTQATARDKRVTNRRRREKGQLDTLDMLWLLLRRKDQALGLSAEDRDCEAAAREKDIARSSVEEKVHLWMRDVTHT